MSKRSKKDYEVGYGKPPPSGRWMPGQSGNPRGRAKGSRNKPKTLSEAVAIELAKDMTVTMDGKKQTVDGNSFLAMRFCRMMFGAKDLSELRRGAEVLGKLDLQRAQEALRSAREIEEDEEYMRKASEEEENRRLLAFLREIAETDYGDDDLEDAEGDEEAGDGEDDDDSPFVEDDE